MGQQRMRKISRRTAIGEVSAALGAVAIAPAIVSAQGRIVRNGRLKQSVSRWPYIDIPFPTFCEAVAEMGLPAIDLLEENDWDIAAEYGLICSMGYGAQTTTKSSPTFNRRCHARLNEKCRTLLHSSATGAVWVILRLFVTA